MKNNYLYAFRERHQLSSGEMAVRIGFSKSYYEKIEYGDRNPSFNFIKKLKETFPDLSAEELLSGTRNV